MSLPIPAVGAFDAPTVTTSINQEWVTILLSALESYFTPASYSQSPRNGIYMRNPSPVWDGDADAQYDADQELQKIFEALAKGQVVVTIPTGTIMPLLSDSVPDGWLKCDGSTYGALTYPDLFAVLPASLKTGSDFTLPNLAGRSLIGDGGSYSLAASGGESTHVLSVDEMPNHGHTVDAHNHTIASHTHTTNPHSHTQETHNHNVNVRENATAFGTAAIATASASGTLNTRASVSATPVINAETVTVNAAPATVTGSATPATDTVGGGNGHNNMSPYFVVNYIIKV